MPITFEVPDLQEALKVDTVCMVFREAEQDSCSQGTPWVALWPCYAR